MPTWTETILKFSQLKKRYKGNLFLKDQVLIAGQRTSTRSMEITPIQETFGTKINSILISMSLSGKIGEKFLNLLKSNSGVLNDYCASDIVAFFNELALDQFSIYVKTYQTTNFQLGNLSSLNTRVYAVLKTPLLRAPRSAATTLLNKLTNPGFSKAAQEIILFNLIDEIIKKKDLIENSDRFINALYTHLKNAGATSHYF